MDRKSVVIHSEEVAINDDTHTHTHTCSTGTSSLILLRSEASSTKGRAEVSHDSGYAGPNGRAARGETRQDDPRPQEGGFVQAEEAASRSSSSSSSPSSSSSSMCVYKR